ncbi:DNA helicase RecQ [Candidatus Riflebacteria bacterium]
MQTRARETLKRVFGYSEFRGLQQQIILSICQGENALVVMPTGSGKSLCYQLPALLLPGTAIIISPLIALMQDQVKSLRELGISARFLNSSQDRWMRQKVLLELQHGKLDLLFLAPERLNNEETSVLLKRCEISLFAIDEAHCVSQWGHDFRPDYLLLSHLKKEFPGVPRLALTATADKRTQKEILQRLAIDEKHSFICGFNRPNIRYQIFPKDNAKEQLLRFILTEHPGEAGIVYCFSRRKVEAISCWLEGKGLKAIPYHAGLSQDLRQKNQARFFREEGPVMVATIAFGMGIDKPNIRFVAHLDLPQSIEAYYQETGRAGRDNLPADAWMVYGFSDLIQIKNLQARSPADEKFKRLQKQRLDAILALCETTRCRREVLLEYFGESQSRACGNCDTCLDPVESINGTVPAQKALSCIIRTGQRFGAGHLIDVLMGKKSPRVAKWGHHKATTFGIGKELSARQWGSVFRQLLAFSFVRVDEEGFGSLKLTELAWPVLKGEKEIYFRKEIPQKKKKKIPEKPRHKLSILEGWKLELFEVLKSKRKQIAEEQNEPAFFVFHNSTLQSMVEVLPENLTEMGAVHGVGEKKLQKYGKEFIKIITGFLQKQPFYQSL